MADLQFTFTDSTLNTIFPFYILIDENLIIKSFGNSIAKMMPDLEEAKLFTDYFTVIRPFKENVQPDNFISLVNQSVIFTSKGINTLTLKGQFERQNSSFLFLGSPWFMSLEEVSQKKLERTDFAFHDSLLEILHVVENQEKNNIELKGLIKTIDTQSKQLKIDKEELNKLSLVASANKNGVVFTQPQGEIFWCNEAFEYLTGFSKVEIIGQSLIEVGRGKLSHKKEVYKMVEAFYNGVAFDVEYVYIKKQGGTFQSKITGQPILDSNGYVSQYFAIIEDITIKKNFSERLEAEREKYSNIIANMNMGLLEVDNNDIIKLANQSFLDMSGYKTKELIGINASDLFSNKQNKLIFEKKINDRTVGLPKSYEIPITTKTGEEKHWLISGAPNYNVNGEIIGSIGIHLDITEQKKLELQKEQLLEKLETQNERLNEYAHMVSHDLKSPLRSIHSLITWIKDENKNIFNETTAQYFELIENKVEKMDNLIQGILTYSKVDSSKEITEKIDLNEIVTNIIQIIHIPDNITVTIKKALPILETDRFRIQQLFQNLISNAVNYIDKKEGFVEIAYDEDTYDYIFSIKDNGQGIDKKYQTKIFELFQSFSEEAKATGIGLSIVKRIVDYYDGAIWLESTLGIGTTFFIKLPKYHGKT
jgi:PAS domain S-box-containing protein